MFAEDFFKEPSWLRKRPSHIVSLVLTVDDVRMPIPQKALHNASLSFWRREDKRAKKAAKASGVKWEAPAYRRHLWWVRQKMPETAFRHPEYTVSFSLPL